MKRFRLSTVMLLIVIAALGLALVVQQERATRREARLQDQLRDAKHRMIFKGTIILNASSNTTERDLETSKGTETGVGK